ncbi:MAG: flagellin [bacterium]
MLSVNGTDAASFLVSAMNSTNSSFVKNSQSLATGSRINRAGDDVAGQNIMQGLTTRSKGYSQANENIGDGISMLDTSDAALGSIHEDLQRVRELTVQGQNGTLSSQEKDAIQSEINSRVENINNISKNSTFNGISLLKPSADISVQSGASDGDQTTVIKAANPANDTGVNIDVAATTGGSIGANSSFALSDLNIGGSLKSYSGNATATSSPLSGLDQMIDNVSRMRSELGASRNSLDSTMDYNDNYNTSLQAAKSQIGDADVGSVVSRLMSDRTVLQMQAKAFGMVNNSQETTFNLLTGTGRR